MSHLDVFEVCANLSRAELVAYWEEEQKNGFDRFVDRLFLYRKPLEYYRAAWKIREAVHWQYRHAEFWREG